MKESPDRRIYKLKTSIVAVIMVSFGLGLIILSRYIDGNASLHWLTYWPIFELGSTLFITGSLVTLWEYVDGRDREQREDRRIRRLLHEAAPDFRDAVVEGFAVKPDDLARVATPELLDSIATNVLGLRLGDPQLAAELYADLRDQAIRAPERWHDAQVQVRLSAAADSSATGEDLFDVVVEWEYTTIPTHPVQRFACVSDRDEFYELVTDVPATLTWLMTSRAGLDATDQRYYELLAFSVDGEERPIRRSARQTGQTYSASIGQDVVDAQSPVRIRQVYRTVTPKSGHRLYFEVGQPTRGFSLEIDYTSTDIAHMSVTDLVSTGHRSHVSRMPEQVDARVLGVDLSGWLLPKSGFAFVWTLLNEQTSAPEVGGRRARTTKP